jgi:hypothetical protein
VNDGIVRPKQSLYRVDISHIGILTEVPAVIGTPISNTIILAVNAATKGTMSVGGQRTLPMFR